MYKNQSALIVFGIFLAIGLSCCGYFVSQTLLKSKIGINTAEAKGLAVRKVESDTVSWDLFFRVHTSDKNELTKLYAKAESHRELIVKLLADNNFSKDEIQIGVLSYNKEEFRDEKQVVVDEKHTLQGKVSVNSHQVRQVAKVRSSVNALIAEGLEIDNSTPVYRYTKLNDIKPSMLREATKNAKIAANEFAQIAGVKVGGIRSARQGNFSVTDVGSSYYDTQTIDKEIRVVTTITFYLKE